MIEYESMPPRRLAISTVRDLLGGAECAVEGHTLLPLYGSTRPDGSDAGTIRFLVRIDPATPYGRPLSVFDRAIQAEREGRHAGAGIGLTYAKQEQRTTSPLAIDASDISANKSTPQDGQ